MSKIAKLMQQAAAGAAGGGVLNVEDVFSTYLYTGNSSTQTITNGIDLDGEGGLVWVKSRSAFGNNMLFDTERGVQKRLITNSTAAEATFDPSLEAFNSDGFTVGNQYDVNNSGMTIASWTFRKAPKFFDVVTYTGTGSPQTIAHNLGSVPGCIITKVTDDATGWAVYHRGNTSAPETERLILEENYATNDDNTYWNDTAPTSTHFTVGTTPRTNSNGKNIVAYLFAHNDGDGEFGPDGDADIIKCGSYTGNGSTNGPEIDLGFEPQWVLIKNASNAASWVIHDVMRGMPVGGGDPYLLPDSSSAEGGTDDRIDPKATGFKITSPTTGTWNTSGDTYIYIAIRRGTKVPESGTEVFAIDTSGASSEPRAISGFPVDMAFRTDPSEVQQRSLSSRLTQGRFLYPNSTAAEASTSNFEFDYSNGVSSLSLPAYYYWMWKRAPNFFDVVAYTGDGVAGRTVSHNLGVAPEMMWIKSRNSNYPWWVYHKDLGIDVRAGLLNDDSASASGYASLLFDSTEPNASEITLGSFAYINGSGDTFIIYLFATLAGISKVGSYTGNGSSQTIDCGFTSGARFVMIKRTDSSGDWVVYDTARGIVSGDDPFLRLNTTDVQVTNDDGIDPASSGFVVIKNGHPNLAQCNESGASYIFYAVA